MKTWPRSVGPGQYVGFVTSPLTDCGGAGDSDRFNMFPRLRSAESTAGLFFQIFPNISAPRLLEAVLACSRPFRGRFGAFRGVSGGFRW